MPLVDYGVIKEFDNSPMPKATYDAHLTGWEMKEGGKGPYYNTEFTIEGGDFHNRKVWTTYSLSDAALWRFKRDMIRLGADPRDMEPGSQVDTDEVIAGNVGASCRIKVEMESYQSNDTDDAGDPITKERPKITEVLAPTVVI